MKQRLAKSAVSFSSLRNAGKESKDGNLESFFQKKAQSSPRRRKDKHSAQASPPSSPNRWAVQYFEPDDNDVQHIMGLLSNTIGFESLTEQDVIDALFICDGQTDLSVSLLGTSRTENLIDI